MVFTLYVSTSFNRVENSFLSKLIPDAISEKILSIFILLFLQYSLINVI